jgi:hypothetical protein
LSKKTYIIQSGLDRKRAFKSGASYPPGGAASTLGVILPKRNFALSTYEVSVGGARWLTNLQPGAVRTGIKIRFTPTGITNTDTRNLIADFYFGLLDGSSLYALDGTDGAFSVALSALTDGVEIEIDLSNWAGVVPTNNYFGLRFWVDGDDPTGVNELTLSTVEIDDYYNLTLSPTKLAIDGDESSGIFVNRTLTHDFTFMHQDGNTPPLAMITFELRYKRQSEGAGSYVTISQTTPVAKWTAAANLFTSGADNTWVWDVRTKAVSQTDFGPRSAQKSFIATANIATPTVTAPTGQISDPMPTITGTSTEGTRTASQARVRNRDTLAVVFLSDEVPGTGLSHDVTTPLDDATDFYAELRVEVDGVWSAWGSAEFNTAFVPPAIPTLAAVPDSEKGCVNLTYSAEDEVALLYSKDYSPLTQTGNWIIIISGLEATDDGFYQFFEVSNNRLLYFKAVARGSTGATSPSAIAQATLGIDVIWIHKLSDPAGSIMPFAAWDIGGNASGWQPKFTPEISIHYFAGVEGPSVNRGEHSTENVSFNLNLITDGTQDDEGWQRLRDLLRVKERVCVRTMEDDVMFIGSITSASGPFAGNNRMNVYSVSFEMIVTG